MNKNLRLPETSRLWKELMNQNPTNDELCAIVLSSEDLQVRAAKKLLERRPTNAHLCSIIEHIPILKVAAAQMLLNQKPSDAELQHIMKHVDALYGQAERKLTQRPRTAILNDILSIVSGRSPQQG